MAEPREAASGIAGAWAALSGAGTAGLGGEALRKARLLNQCAALAALTNLGFTAGYWFNPRLYAFPLVVNLLAAVGHVFVPMLARRGMRRAALFLFLALCNGQLFAVARFLGPAVGYHYYFIAFATVVFLVTPRKDVAFYPFSLLSLGAYLFFIFGMREADAVVQVEPMIALFSRGVTISTTFFTLMLIGFLFDSATGHAEHRLEEEHERSEQLLLNILPRTISDRLKGGQKSIADGFAEVSVLFADIVGFTELSARMPPADLVRVLNHVFSAFDELAERLGLEKIKTIGDAYMVAAGLPEPRPDHAVAITEMGLAMREALARLNEEHGYGLNIRIGVHSGPVVAGVIGKKKFIYDLWGDTVNTASRMESHGDKGTVHVSQATAALIGDAFELESRGTIPVKGKGSMETFFVRGRKSAAGAEAR